MYLIIIKIIIKVISKEKKDLNKITNNFKFNQYNKEKNILSSKRNINNFIKKT